eukprot:11215710-Lingulodinium_polyedra.AAC.1
MDACRVVRARRSGETQTEPNPTLNRMQDRTFRNDLAWPETERNIGCKCARGRDDTHDDSTNAAGDGGDEEEDHDEFLR